MPNTREDNPNYCGNLLIFMLDHLNTSKPFSELNVVLTNKLQENLGVKGVQEIKSFEEAMTSSLNKLRIDEKDRDDDSTKKDSLTWAQDGEVGAWIDELPKGTESKSELEVLDRNIENKNSMLKF